MEGATNIKVMVIAPHITFQIIENIFNIETGIRLKTRLLYIQTPKIIVTKTDVINTVVTFDLSSFSTSDSSPLNAIKTQIKIKDKI